MLYTIYFIPHVVAIYVILQYAYVIWARATRLFSDAHVETSTLFFFSAQEISMHDLCWLYIRSCSSQLL